MVDTVRETSERSAAGTNATPDVGDTPAATPANVLPATSVRMSKQARRDTAPELLLRRRLHRMGLRYRVDAPLPGMPRRRADILFSRAKVAVFVDGCFWHGCPEHKTSPANNGMWWAAKLARNVERDRETDTHMSSLGWTVLRVWEHDDVDAAASDIAQIVRAERFHPVDGDTGRLDRGRAR